MHSCFCCSLRFCIEYCISTMAFSIVHATEINSYILIFVIMNYSISIKRKLTVINNFKKCLLCVLLGNV